MSAPKPRVSRTVTFIGQPGKAATAHRWTWVCECGASDPSPHGLVLHRLAMDDATLHSRTHTAERVADELMRRHLGGECAERSARERRDWVQADYWMGRKDGYLDALALVREHLVWSAS